MYKLMPISIEETVMFVDDDDTSESLFDKLVSFASVKHSLGLDDKPVRAGTKRDADTMEKDMLSEESRRLARAARVSLAGFATKQVI